MNQKGEILVVSCLVIFLGSALFLLTFLQLKKSFTQLQRRAKIFLCVKEAKGELHSLLSFNGRLNWAIKNINRAQLVTHMIPGVSFVSAKALKKSLQQLQQVKIVSFLKNLALSSKKGCPIDLNMMKTPFKNAGLSFKRDFEGRLILREQKWTYKFNLSPYTIRIEVDATHWERIKPVIYFQSF